MIASWAKVDGEWVVRLQDAEWPGGTGTGLPVTVTSKSGVKKDVVLGDHIRTWRIKGGRFVDLYRVMAERDAQLKAASS